MEDLMTSSAVPPGCGRRLIPTLVDDIATSEPERVYAAIPKTDDISDGWYDVTYQRFAVAASRCARLIEDAIGVGSADEVLFYMGPLDLRFPIILLGAVKTGHIAQFSSTRNSLEAHLSLLENAKCKTILLPDDAPSITEELQARLQLDVIKIPSLAHFLNRHDDGADEDLYAWNAKFDDVRTKPLVVLHTSGSTGLPKPVFVTHGTFASNDMHQSIPSLGGRPAVLVELLKQNRVFVAFPLFHAACLGIVLGYSVFTGAIPVLPPPGPLTIEAVDYAHQHAKVKGSLLPPSVVVDIYKSSQAYQNLLENIEWVAYVGGTLANEVGDRISQQVRLVTLMGATETMYLPIEAVDKQEDWQQIPISPFLGHEYQLRHDGLSELVIKRDAALDLFQGVFCTFPEKTEYGMQDLYSQSKSNPRYWSFSARGDDLICFSNAEKLNPITLEAIITSHPRVKGALIGGQGQFQASLLIEPHEPHPLNDKERDDLIKDIWPTVMKGNRETVAHGRIMKNFIIFTDSDRPLPRAGKTTIQRFSAMKLYAEDFKALYTRSHMQENLLREAEDVRVPHEHSEVVTKIVGDDATTTQAREPRIANESKLLETEMLFARLEKMSQRFENALLRMESMMDAFRPSSISMQHSEKHDSGTQVGVVEIRSSYSDGTSLSRSSSSSSSSSDHGTLRNDSLTVHELQDLVRWKQPELINSAELRVSLLSLVTENAIVYGLTETADLFDCGLDSLQIPVVVAAINEFLLTTYKHGSSNITNKDIFQHRTVEELATAITCKAQLAVT